MSGDRLFQMVLKEAAVAKAKRSETDGALNCTKMRQAHLTVIKAELELNSKNYRGNLFR